MDVHARYFFVWCVNQINEIYTHRISNLCKTVLRFVSSGVWSFFVQNKQISNLWLELRINDHAAQIWDSSLCKQNFTLMCKCKCNKYQHSKCHFSFNT